MTPATNPAARSFLRPIATRAIALSIGLAGLAAAGPVTVTLDNTLSGVTDGSGALITTATAKVGWFQSPPAAIGADLAALEAAFVEVGRTGQGSFSEFSTAFNFDDTGSFEGVAYSGFAGQTMYGLMVSAAGDALGVVRFDDTFPTGASSIPPDTSSSAGWNPGTCTPVLGAFSGNDIGGGNPSFQLVPAGAPAPALVIEDIDKTGATVTITYDSGGSAIDLYRSADLEDFSGAVKIATDDPGDGTVVDPAAPALTAFYKIVPKDGTP